MKYFLVLLFITSAFAVSNKSKSYTFYADSVNDQLNQRIQEVDAQRYWFGGLLGNLEVFYEALIEIGVSYDDDKNELIDQAEFHQMALDYYEFIGSYYVPSEHESKVLFEYYDFDQSGFLDIKEIEFLLREQVLIHLDSLSYESAYLKIEAGYLDDAFKVPGSQQEGEATLKFLNQYLNQTNYRLNEMRTWIADLGQLEDTLKGLFYDADKNYNGKLSFRESLPLVKEIFEYLQIDAPSDGEIKEGFDQFDYLGGGDGEVDGEEFAVFAEKVLVPTLVFSYVWQTEAKVYVEHAVDLLTQQGYGQSEQYAYNGTAADPVGAVFLEKIYQENPSKKEFQKNLYKTVF